MTQPHNRFMHQAFLLAEKAYREKEVPVGAVVVLNDEIIGKGYNQTEQLRDATAHAEMLAISTACSTLGKKYLDECTIYVTLEPCPMCTGAIVWSKMKRIVFGVPDEKAGACGTLFNLAFNRKLNHQTEIIQGIMETDCRELLLLFFSERRKRL